MAYKNMKHNKRHIKALRHDPLNWRAKNRRERKQRQVEREMAGMKKIAAKMGLNF